MEDVYELFRRGGELLQAGHFHQAAVPLRRARDLEPGQASIREALGRALFRSRQFDDAAEEFAAVVDMAPTNDYALFCLGRSLMELGRPAEARGPLALAACLRPERHDYRVFRDRARAVAGADAEGDEPHPAVGTEDGSEPEGAPETADAPDGPGGPDDPAPGHD